MSRARPALWSWRCMCPPGVGAADPRGVAAVCLCADAVACADRPAPCVQSLPLNRERSRKAQRSSVAGWKKRSRDRATPDRAREPRPRPTRRGEGHKF